MALVIPFGIYGVLIGTLAGAAYRTPILIHYANKNIIKRSPWEFWKKVLKWMPLFITVTVISIVSPMKCTTLANWILVAIPVAVAMLAVCIIWLLAFDRSTLKEFIRILKNKLGKGRKTNEGN